MFEKVFTDSEFSDGLLHWLPQQHQDPQDPVSNLTFANKGTDCVRLSGCAPPPPPHAGGSALPSPEVVLSSLRAAHRPVLLQDSLLLIILWLPSCENRTALNLISH